MLFDYQKVNKERMSITLEDGREFEGTFIDLRIDPATIPSGLIWYQMRHCDDDWGTPASINRGGIFVNFFGTFITDADLGLSEETEVIDYSYS